MSTNYIPGTPGTYDMGVAEPYLTSLPEAEQEHAGILFYNLVTLNAYLNDYASAVGLHRYSLQLKESVLAVSSAGTLQFNRNLHLLQNWGEMAGRDAAMTVFHVGKILKQIKGMMRHMPTLHQDVDSASLRKATGDLEAAFPNHGSARHAVGHRAEALAGLDVVKSHGIPVEGGIKYVIGNVEGDTYLATFDKKLVRVELTEAARQRLNLVIETIYGAFPKLLPFLPPIENAEAELP